MVDSTQVDTLKMVVILVINPLKIVIMEIRKYMKTLPLVAAMLLIASCSSEDSEITEAPQVAKTILIPYEATVSSGSQTRATLVGDYYKFQSGDKLFVYDDNNKISGELTLTSVNEYNEAVFEGTLTYTTNSGDPATPANDLSLNAVLKGENDKLLPSTVGEYKSSGANYSTAIGSSLTDAVEKYSFFKDDSPYGDKSFTSLMQWSTFVSFAITLEDGTAADEDITVTVNNGGSAVCSGNVKTVDEGGAIKAKFTAALPGGTTLSGATVKLGSRAQIDFGRSRTLDANKNYTVTKTYRYKMSISIQGQDPKERGYGSLPTISLADVISARPEYATYVKMISGCEFASGDNIIDVTGEAPDLVLTANGTGTCNMNVKAGGGLVTIPVTFIITDLKSEP